ncbi:hypothetical protein OHC33_004547 [Knufia fluminis]|uniref:Uncharacterized protein n=1 Tax=Knufia fluminis TaxID=191047 RepID=A0AAN8FAV7_9EURO|nr:hypothetical protein OHC33_004547 [Knufia fluminis]
MTEEVPKPKKHDAIEASTSQTGVAKPDFAGSPSTQQAGPSTAHSDDTVDAQEEEFNLVNRAKSEFLSHPGIMREIFEEPTSIVWFYYYDDSTLAAKELVKNNEDINTVDHMDVFDGEGFIVVKLFPAEWHELESRPYVPGSESDLRRGEHFVVVAGRPFKVWKAIRVDGELQFSDDPAIR